MDSWPAPAKLNLFLHVTGRRADGFCIRAARSLQRQAGTGQGVTIDLTKRIPAGGGLGGGSSDAATTLIALNRLWGLGLSIDALAEIGLGLGADVPVFVRGRAAWAEGVGERLQPVELDEACYLVLCPGVSISTAAIFSDPELTRDSPAITIRAFREGSTRNDLESLVRKRYPEVDRTLSWLSRYGQPRMTGTGACVFMPVEERRRGEELLATALGQADDLAAGLTGFVAKGLNRHPLCGDG